jgi:transposase
LKKVNLQGFIYVADSAAMTKVTLDQARQAQAYLITRGGNNLKMVKEVLEQADRPDAQWSEPQGFAMSNTRAMYRLQEHTATYEGYSVRLIVVESSALDKKKAHTLEKQVEEERQQAEASIRWKRRLSLRGGCSRSP